MSIALGRLALMASGSEKIEDVREIKKYAERAIQLDPLNFKAYHVLGKWYFEVSNLSSFERWLVKVTYGALPAASYAEAIKNYEKSRQLNPALLVNYLELAKCYYNNNDKKKAIEFLKMIPRIPNSGAEDPTVRIEAKTFLEKWSN